MTLSQMLGARHVGVKELKNNISMLFKTHKPIVATDRGQPTYFLIPYEDIVELIEMIEEARDAKLIRAIQSGRKSYKKGKWRPASKLWKKLGV